MLLGLVAHAAWAEQPAAAESVSAEGQSIAVLPFDALGMDEDRVGRLESLFRNELERLAKTPGPPRRQLQEVLRTNRNLAACSGQARCLSEIGRLVGATVVVSGNVAALGDSYVVNIKAVDVGSAQERNRVISDPLQGDADQLIEAVRIAAYRLLAPERLRGEISVLADIDGARVSVDGAAVGTTPLPVPIRNLALGKHKVTVTRTGFSTFAEEVEVRFQKTTKVVVRLAASSDDPAAAALAAPRPRPAPRKTPWYRSTWFAVGIGAVAVGAGAFVGWQLGKDNVIDCREGGC